MTLGRPETGMKEEAEVRMSWWTEARFGMFIHWGLYALAARHEWVRERERLSDEDYARYFDHFDPDLFDPRAWARLARAAGMKYVVVTAKHHDGFCLWDSALTDFKAPRTPYGRDLLGPIIEAFRTEGLRIGLYYSLLDWHHPHYTVDRFHPLRDSREFVDRARGRDLRIYVEYLFGQVRELLTRFGPIDILFFDYSFPGPDGKGRKEWRSRELLDLVRGLRPEILVNDRLDLLDVPGGWDYRTPEQFIPGEGLRADGHPVPWETCQTFSGSWGYHRDESTWKTARQLIVLLIEAVGKGGNLLLNVGPTARGMFDGRAVRRLERIGAWMALHGRSISGCTRPPEGITAPGNCLLTWNPLRRRLYVHVLEWPVGELRLEGLAGKVVYAQILHDASEIPFIEAGQEAGFLPGDRPPGSRTTLELRLPVLRPDVEVPTLELFLRGET